MSGMQTRESRPKAPSATLTWQWGSFNAPMRAAVDAAIAGEVAGELRGIAAQSGRFLSYRAAGGRPVDFFVFAGFCLIYVVASRRVFDGPDLDVPAVVVLVPPMRRA